MQVKRTAATALALAALAVPAAAVANQDESHGQGEGNGKGQAKGVAWVFKGTYAGEGSLTVQKGNWRVRKAGFVGDDVSFDFTNAKIRVADTNGNQVVDLNDVAVGDKLLVKARLPCKDPGTQPFAAQRLVDQTHPPVDKD